MSYEIVDDDYLTIPDFSFICPKCKDKTVHIHDLRCGTCNDRDIVWCPTCEKHYRVKLE